MNCTSFAFVLCICVKKIILNCETLIFVFKKETKNKKDMICFCVVLKRQMIKHAYFNFRKYTFKYITA